MRTSQCAVYQVKETPEYRDAHFRSYKKLRSEGKSVSIKTISRCTLEESSRGKLRRI